MQDLIEEKSWPLAFDKSSKLFPLSEFGNGVHHSPKYEGSENPHQTNDTYSPQKQEGIMRIISQILKLI